MKLRLTPPLAMLPLVVLLAASAACSRRRHDACGDASTTSAELGSPPWTRIPPPSPRTPDVPPPEPPARPARPAPPADEGPRAPSDATEAAGATATPDWVPDSGRLTIVEARDLARNLGIATATAAPDGGVKD